MQRLIQNVRHLLQYAGLAKRSKGGDGSHISGAAGAALGTERSQLTSNFGGFEALERREHLTVNILSPLPDRTVLPGASNLVISLANRYDNPAITGTTVRFNTNQTGANNFFNVELFDAARAAGQETAQSFRTRTTPLSAANFLQYLNAGRYTNTIIHRVVTNFIVQGGGFTSPTAPSNAAGPEADPGEVTTFPTINNEPGNNNVRGTLSFAKLGGSPNSATSQWFVNTNDNRGTNPDGLDFQNGGFTAFARVLGNGMTVVDALANVPNFNANTFYGQNQTNGPFTNLPLRNIPAPTPPTLVIQPNQFVTITSIVIINEITYTVTSSNAALVSPSINANGELVLGFNASGTGVANITVVALSADGTSASDTFAIGVTPVELGPVSASPPTLSFAGPNVTLTATDPTTAPGATITRVDFYRDVNANGLVDAGTDTLLGSDSDGVDGWSTTFSSLGLPAGNPQFLAIAVDSSSRSSAPSVTTIAVTRSTPVSLTGAAANNPVIAYTGLPVTITATGAATLTPAGTITAVESYRDTNGNGIIDLGVDTLLGTDTDGSDGFTIAVSTLGFTQGANTILTIARDSDDRISEVRSTIITVTQLSPAVLGSFTAAPLVLTRLTNPLTLTASGAATQGGGTITGVFFFRDANGNGTLDWDFATSTGDDVLLGTVATPTGGGQYVLTIADPSAQGFIRNSNAVLAVARDSNDRTSRALTQIVVGAPQITASPSSVLRGNSTILTVAPIVGVGTTTRVRYYIDSNGDGNITPGVDRLLGTAAFIGGTYRLTVASTSLNFGASTVMARADLAGGTTADYSNVVITVNNNLPTITSLSASPRILLTSGGFFTLTATVSDRDGTVSRVTFYADDGDGIFDSDDLAVGQDDSAVGGWRATLSSSGLAPAAYRFFAVATDNNGGESVPTPPVGQITVRVNSLPVIASLSGPVTSRTGIMTLTATNVGDDGTLEGRGVVRVEFWRDLDDDGVLTTTVDRFLGNGTRAAGSTNWTFNFNTTGALAGEIGFIARAVDADGAFGDAVSGTGIVLNVLPAITGISARPTTVPQPGGTITLTAVGVSDRDGTVRRVRFFLDTNNNGTLDYDFNADSGTDTLLGDDQNPAGGFSSTFGLPGSLTGGNYRFFAVASDNNAAGANGNSPPAVTFVRVNRVPLINTTTGGISFTGGSTVARTGTFTVQVTGATDPDTDGSVTRIEFWRDRNGNNTIESTDLFLGNGIRSGSGATAFYRLTRAAAGFATGSNAIMARAVDNLGGFGVTVSATLTVTNAPPVAGRLIFGGTVIASPGLDPLTLSVTGLSDADGSIASVRFYRDSDGTPGLDVLTDELVGEDLSATGGWSISADTDGISASSATYFAVVTDNEAAQSTTAGAVINVNTRPTAGALTITETTVIRGSTATGNVAAAADADGTISRVEFWLDRNGDSLITAADLRLGNGVRQTDGSYRLTFSTAAFAAGLNNVLAQSIDNRGGRSNASLSTLTVTNRGPIAGTLAIAPAILATPGISRLTLTVTGLSDPDGVISRVRFYRDSDGIAGLDTSTDELVGEDLLAAGGWSISAATTGVGGTSATYFAQVVDSDLATATTAGRSVIVNQTPTLTGISLLPATLARTGTIVATATGGADADAGSSIARVEFFRDTNGNGVLDTGEQRLGNGVRQPNGDYRLSFSTVGFVLGNVEIAAQAVDNRGGIGASVAATATIENRLPTASSLRSSVLTINNPGTDTITLTAVSPADGDGSVARVRFYRESDGIAGLDTAADTLLGEDPLAAGGYTLLAPTTGLGSATSATYYAIVIDNDGGSIAAPLSVEVVVNQRPTITAVTFDSATVARLTNAVATATGVADADGTITRVEFWRDRNANGTIESTDQLLGSGVRQTDGSYRLSFATAGFVVGDNTIMARAIDNRTGLGVITPATLAITNLAPVGGRLSLSSNLLASADVAVTMSLLGFSDRDGTVEAALFYYDVNSNGVVDDGIDILIGTDANSFSGFNFLFTPGVLPGATFPVGTPIQLLAVPRDNNNTLGTPVATTFTINRAPTITSATATDGTTANELRRTSNNNTVTASGITDPDGTISRVEFWLDTNSDGAITPADYFLGIGTRIAGTDNWRLIFSGSIIPAALFGSGALLTRATDNNGGFSNIVSTTIVIT